MSQSKVSDNIQTLEDVLGITPLKYLIPQSDISTICSSYNISLDDTKVLHNSSSESLHNARMALESKANVNHPVVNFMKDLIESDESINLQDVKFKSDDTSFIKSLEKDNISDIVPNNAGIRSKIGEDILQRNKESAISQAILKTILGGIGNIEISDDGKNYDSQSKFEILCDNNVSQKTTPSHSCSRDVSQMESFYDLAIMPSLKKRKVLPINKKREKSVLFLTELKSTIIYINPDELKLNSLKQIVSLVNEIVEEEKITLGDVELKYFDLVDDFETPVILNSEIICKLEDSFTRLFGNFNDFNFDKEIYDNSIFNIQYVSKIQSLCMSSIKYGLIIDWSHIINNIADCDLDVTQKLKICESSLRCCLIMLMIFLSGREDKIIYLEEYITSVVGFVSKIIGDLVVPMIGHSEMIEINGECPKDMSNKLQIIGNLVIQCLKKLDNYVNVDSIFPNRKFTSLLNDYILTKLEYICINSIFSDIETRGKSLPEFIKIFIHTFSQSIRNSSMNILLSIFRKYHNQRTFILDEILNNFGHNKIFNNRYPPRQFKLSKRGINVQTFTILILGLVQTYNVNNVSLCIPIWKHNEFIFKASFHESLNTSLFIPDIHLGKIKLNSLEKPKLYKIILDYQNYLFAEKSSLNTICNNISSFIVNKLSNNFEASSKILIEAFIDDLLNLLEFPEWPGSETLLLTIMNTFMYVFTSSKYHANIETFSLEMVGLIGCKLAGLKNSVSSSEIWIPSPSISSSDFKKLSQTFDLCLQYVKELADENSFFLSNFNFLLFKWVQTLESLKQQMIRDGLSLEMNQNNLTEMDNDKNNDLTEDLTNIKIQRNIEKKLLQQSELFRSVISEYYKYLSLIGTKKFQNSDISVNMISTNSQEACENSKETSMKPDIHLQYLHLLVSQPLLNSYDQFLKLVIASLNHQKIKSRTRAVKNLSSIIKKDKLILSNARIKKIIFDRINDRSSLVRDATIDLVCNFILSDDNNTESEANYDYLKLIINKVTDQSLAVQRRVLKLAQPIYSILKSRELKVLFVFNLLKIMYHEDASIIDTAAKTLIDILFVPVYDETHKKDLNDLKITSVVLKNAEILSYVIFNSNRKVWQLFQEFIDKYVFFNGIRGKNHRRKINFALCHDDLISILEIYADKIVDNIIENHNSLNRNGLPTEKLFGLLSILIKGCGKLINQDQLMLLSPYLNDDSSTGNSICLFTLNIFKNALPCASSLRPTFIQESQRYLLKRLTRFNSKELDEAIPCIWIISNINRDISQVSNACISCLKLIKPYLNKTIDKSDPTVIRLLYLIGFIGKYCNFENNRELFLKANIGLQPEESITSLITKYILAFCQNKVFHQVKRIAIKNLINLCGSHANLFMSEYILKIIDREVLYPPIDQNLDIVETILEGINTFLKDEEEKSVKQVGLGISISTDITLDVDVFHGKYSSKEKDGVLASLAQRYMNKILELCVIDVTSNYSIVITCVKFLETFVKQGFANPRLVIGVIIALELSPASTIRSIARDLHIELHNRYESLVESKYIDGLKIASEKAGRQHSISSEQVYAFSGFYEIINNSRSSKKKFITSLSRSLCSVSSKDDDLKSCISYSNFVEFILSRLGKMELSSLEEYYILLQSIDKFVIKEGSNLQYEHQIILSNNGEPKPRIGNDRVFKKIANVALSLYNLCRYKTYIMERYNINKKDLEIFNIHKVDKELQNSPPLLDDLCEFNVLYFIDFAKLYMDDDDQVLTKEFALKIYQKFIDYLYASDISWDSSQDEE